MIIKKDDVIDMLVKDINDALAAMPDDKSAQDFLDGISEGFFNLPYQTEGDDK